MKRLAVFASFAMVAANLVAAQNSGFGVDAFNRAISAATRGNAVFSPVSYEIDCVIFSEAFDALTRAKIAESMGVLNGLELAYQPLYERLSNAGEGFGFLQARAFCLPDERKANRAYRQWMQKSFAAEAFTFDHHNKKGAECWFRARLDGEMEDFSLPDNAADTTHYSFFDIVSANCRLRSTSVSNCIVSQKFILADSTSRMVPAISAVLPVDVWKRANSSVIRMPLSDNSWFYALTPKEGLSVRDIRGELSSNTLIDLIGGIKSITEINVSHGTTSVVVPVIDIVSQLDLTLPFGYFHIPLAGMERLDSKIKPRHVCQSVRFRLTEAKSDPTVAEESVRSPIANIARVELSRPFLFFVYHEPTATIPVAGQFMGTLNKIPFN